MPLYPSTVEWYTSWMGRDAGTEGDQLQEHIKAHQANLANGHSSHKQSNVHSKCRGVGASNYREKEKGYMYARQRINTKKATAAELPQFLPYDDAYEQDEYEDDDGGHDALLVHPASRGSV